MIKILIVEDSTEMSDIISLVLKMEGYELVKAIDGTSALKQAREQMPDLILMDVVIPAPSGFEVAKILKADPQTRDIPIIFVSIQSDTYEVLQGLEYGVDYITKPFAVPELAARVRNAVRTYCKKSG